MVEQLGVLQRQISSLLALILPHRLVRLELDDLTLDFARVNPVTRLVPSRGVQLFAEILLLSLLDALNFIVSQVSL